MKSNLNKFSKFKLLLKFTLGIYGNFFSKIHEVHFLFYNFIYKNYFSKFQFLFFFFFFEKKFNKGNYNINFFLEKPEKRSVPPQRPFENGKNKNRCNEYSQNLLQIIKTVLGNMDSLREFSILLDPQKKS